MTPTACAPKPLDPTSLPADLVRRVLEILQGATDCPDPNRHLRTSLDEVAAGHPGRRIDLITDDEAYDGRRSHAALIREADGRTVSVAVSDPVGLPWPLRGVARAREYDLLRVNETTMTVQEAMACIDGMFDDRHLLRSLIDACLIGEAIDRAGLVVTDQDIRSAAATFRRRHGLRTAAATSDWLAHRSLSDEQFGHLIEQQARIAALRRLVVGDRVDAQLTDPATGDDAALVQVAWVRADRGSAGAGTDQAADLAADPLGAIVTARRQHREAGLEHWPAAAVPARFSEMLGAARGDVRLLPGEPPTLAVVVDRSGPDSVARERERLTRSLFQEWLAQRRRSARVEWFWGNEDRTAAAVGER